MPAGTFDAFTIEVTGSDGSKNTIWITKTTRQPVKQAATVASMNGATITSELQK